jgi:Restriction endonuclease/Clp amino terminal domain, pathogenicity island component
VKIPRSIPASLISSAPVPHFNVDSMSGAEFEAYVGAVLRSNGYLVNFTAPTGDFGVDLVARRGSETIGVQCKRHITPIGAKAVQQVVVGAIMYACTSTMVVTNQSFTPAAVALADRHNCVLIDGRDLARLATGRKSEDHAVGFVEQVRPAGDIAKSTGKTKRAEMTMFERFTRTARIAVVLAHEEARELEAADIRPEHLLVGVLRASTRELSSVLRGYGLAVESVRMKLAESPEESFADDAEALRTIGIDLRAVKDAVTQAFGADAWRNASRMSRRRGRSHIPFTDASQQVLKLALREALAREDSYIGCEHILLGILRGGDKAAIGLITEHVYTAQLRAAIIKLMDKAA